MGLASGLSSGAWLLPQLLVASLVAQLPRKKPVVVRAAALSRPVLLLMALTVWLVGAQIRALTLAVTLLGIVIFYAGDACASVPWFDLVAKGLPLQRRGRVLGAGQMIGSLGAVGAGVLVRYVLAPASPWAFPTNYALLFGMLQGPSHGPFGRNLSQSVIPVKMGGGSRVGNDLQLCRDVKQSVFYPVCNLWNKIYSMGMYSPHVRHQQIACYNRSLFIGSPQGFKKRSGYLCNIIIGKLHTLLLNHAKGLENLVEFVQLYPRNPRCKG